MSPSERFMRHYYGASGYVSREEQEKRRAATRHTVVVERLADDAILLATCDRCGRDVGCLHCDGEGIPPDLAHTADKRNDAAVCATMPTCPTCRHHTLDDKGDHWCALDISTAGRVPGLVTHLQPFGCSLHEGKGASDE